MDIVKPVLENGFQFPCFDLVYQTWGKANAAQDNIIWICHAFTGSHDVAEWWQGLVGPGKLFNPENNLIVCVNIPGSHYGSTGPLSVNPLTGQPYFHTFPALTIRDVVNSFELLRKHLKIKKIKTCIGGSMGGQQALEWAIMKPELIDNLILVATNAVHSSWGIAFNESQRMSIEVDPTWTESNSQAGINGMKAARATALISYRNYETYQITQARQENSMGGNLRAVSYQRYQGEKLAKRFNAISYNKLTKLLDTHNIARGRFDTMEEALASIGQRTLIIGIHSDLLCPVSEQVHMNEHIPDCEYQEIESLYGHDGFLIENEEISVAIRNRFEFIS